MNYQEFVGSVTEFLRESLPGGTKLERIPLEKNNGVIADGLTVRQEGRQVAPAIYLDACYREYLQGRSLSGIYNRILACCENRSVEERLNTELFTDYERLRDFVVYKLVNYERNRELLTRIPHLPFFDLAIVFYLLLTDEILGTATVLDFVVYKLVNYERNRELLTRIPHLPFFDLAIVFYLLLTDEILGTATVLIHNSHLKLWNAGCSDLYRDARRNSVRLLPARLSRMSDVIRELSGEEEFFDMELPMYVLTNEVKALGAACILYEGILDRCAKTLGEDYYILPSSIHEVILVPSSAVQEPGELCRMVRDINETQVEDTEVLSDQAYLYSSESGQITLIK